MFRRRSSVMWPRESIVYLNDTEPTKPKLANMSEHKKAMFKETRKLSGKVTKRLESHILTNMRVGMLQ